MKTLSPRWDETFTTSFPTKEFTEFAAFELTLFDYDKRSDDDPMGVILVKIPLDVFDTTTKWYGVPATSLDGEEATGRIECTMRSKRRTLQPGEAPKAYQEPVIPLILQKGKRTSFHVKKPKFLKKKKRGSVTGATGPKEDQVELDITIVRARNLAAMDRNILGKQKRKCACRMYCT